MRHVALLGLAALAVAALPARHAAAQGLLHKHRHAAGPSLGAMRSLPAQTAPTAATTATAGDVASSAGAAAALPVNPNLPGAVGGSPGTAAICIVPPAPLDGVPIDAVPMPMPSIDGGPAIACIDYPCIHPGFAPVVDPGVAPGFDPGIDPGSTVSVGGWPVAPGPVAIGFSGRHHTKPLAGGDAAPGGPLMYGRPIAFSPMNAATPSTSAFGQAQAAAATTGPPGRNVAAGLPGRAVGVRPGTLDVPSRRQMTPIGGVPGGSTASSGDVRRDQGVIQAAGIAPQHDGATRRAGTGVTPAAAASSAATATPTRWRDRLHFAWPTTK